MRRAFIYRWDYYGHKPLVRWITAHATGALWLNKSLTKRPFVVSYARSHEKHARSHDLCFATFEEAIRQIRLLSYAD